MAQRGSVTYFKVTQLVTGRAAIKSAGLFWVCAFMLFDTLVRYHLVRYHFYYYFLYTYLINSLAKISGWMCLNRFSYFNINRPSQPLYPFTFPIAVHERHLLAVSSKSLCECVHTHTCTHAHLRFPQMIDWGETQTKKNGLWWALFGVGHLDLHFLFV